MTSSGYVLTSKYDFDRRELQKVADLIRTFTEPVVVGIQKEIADDIKWDHTNYLLSDDISSDV